MKDEATKQRSWWKRLLGYNNPAPFAYIEPYFNGDLPAINTEGADHSTPVRIAPTFTDFLAVAPEPRAHAAQISTALHRLYEQPQEESAATNAADDQVFRTLSRLFPVAHDRAESGHLVLTNEKSALFITPSKVSLLPMADKDGHSDIKKAFSEESAYAMALVASKSKRMLENGIRLKGSQEQQDVLRIAIERVNSELPADQRLRILPPIAVVQPAHAAENNVTDAQPTSAPLKAAPVEPVAAPANTALKHDAAPEAENVTNVVDPARRRFFSFLGNKGEKPAASERPSSTTTHNTTRRDIVAGVLAGLIGGMPSLLNQGKAVPDEVSQDAKKAGLDRSSIEPAGEGESNLPAKPGAQAKAEPPVKATPPASKPHGAKPNEPTRATPKGDFARNSERGRAAVPEDKPAPRTELAERSGRKPVEGQVRITRQVTGDRVVLNLAHVNPLECTPSDFRRCHDNFNYVARDWRQNKIANMDPALMNVIAEVTTRLRARGYAAQELTLNSGYRTRETNREARGAKNSLHLVGKAIDFSIEGVSPRVLCDVCSDVVGNKGWVKRHSTFTHLDTRGFNMRLG